VLLRVVALSASPARAWLFVLPGSRPTAARALDFAGDGTVVAAGDLSLGLQSPFAVVRLDPDRGDPIGLYLHEPARDGRAHALVVRDDDAFAAGEGSSAADASELVVTRSGPLGNEVWATRLNGTASCGADVAYGLALDAAGDVVAVGQLSNASIEVDVTSFTAVKLDGADGALLWKTEIDEGMALAAVFDGPDVLATGTIQGSFSVVRFDGATGAVEWRTDVGAGEGTALVLGAAGTVFVAGRLGGDFAVAKVDTDTGDTLWPDGAGTIDGSGIARGVTALPDGDVVAAGEVGVGAVRRFATARFADADGDLVWQDAAPSVPAPAAAWGVANDAAGGIVSVGTAAHQTGPSSFSARALQAGDGGLRWGDGILSDDPETRALTVRFDANRAVLVAGQLSAFGGAVAFTVRKLDAAGNDFEPACGNDQLDSGEQCDDGNTFDGDCCSSTCTFEPPSAACESDGNDCTTDRCDGEGTCIHPPATPGTACDDADDCTTGELCSGTTCGGGDLAQIGTPCDADSNDCTDDACNADGICVATPNAGPCDDQNPCTTNDVCQLGFCFGTPQTGTSCDDFNPCTTTDRCQTGFCLGAPAPGLPCFDDFNPCTDDVCAPEGFCAHPSNTAPCDDADACTGADQCQDGVCVGTAGGGTTTSTSTSTSTSSSTSSSSTAPTTSPSSSSTSSSTSSSSSTSTTATSPPTSTTSSSSSSSSTLQTTSSTSTSPTSSTVAGSTSTTSSSTAVPSTSSSSSTTPTPPSTTTTITLPAPCTTAADCDDGDPCNGGETCAGGSCLVARGGGTPACTGADPIAVVTRFRADAVTLMNTRTRAVEGTIGVGEAPWGVAWSPGGERAFVTNREGRSVTVIDAVARTVLATIPVGPEPLGIAAHPFLPRAYVASYGADRIEVIDTTVLAVVDTIAVGDGPSGVAVHPAGGTLFVASYLAGRVAAIDLATHAVVATVATPALPVGIAIHPAGTKAYVACLQGREVAVVGTVSHTLLRTIRVGRKPIGVAFDGAGARAYVTNSGDDTVTVLDAAADRAIAKRPVGKFPIGVAVAGDGTVWVAGSKADEVGVLGTAETRDAVAVPDTPVAIGTFIGTPPDDCPAAPLPCDDANPYTGDACQPGAGCVQADITGVAAVRVGADAITALVEAAGADDPLGAELRADLPGLTSALEAAGTGGDRTALRLVRRSLKPILVTLERARRQRVLGTTGARLLDIAREARRQLRRLARTGGRS
jgi:YVTN family beta-propeller protein/cysteine-rich repeat protein